MSLEVRRTDAASQIANANAAAALEQTEAPAQATTTANAPAVGTQTVDAFDTAPATGTPSREGEGLPLILFAIFLRTLLAQGASVSGKTLLKKALAAGGQVIRTNGSHKIVRMPNGRTAPIPVHGNKDLPIGTLKSIKNALGI